MARIVADVNRRLGPEEKVRRFAILERDFLPEKGELTPTLKVKRRVVEEHFGDEIDELYAKPRARFVGDSGET
jgi:long-chain acyl-CoA synthetase